MGAWCIFASFAGSQSRSNCYRSDSSLMTLHSSSNNITRSSLILEFKGMSMTQVTFHMLTFQMSLNTTSQYGFLFWALQMAYDLGGAGHLIWLRLDHETTYVSFSRWLNSSSRQPALTSGYLNLTTSRSSMGKTNCCHGQLLYVFGPVT